MKRKSIAVTLLLAFAIICGVAANPGYHGLGKPPLSVQYFNVTAVDSGDNEVIDAVAGKKFFVLWCTVQSTTQSTAVVGCYFHCNGTAVAGSATGTYPIDKTGISGYQGFSWGEAQSGRFQTATAGQDLKINLSAAQPVNVMGAYVEID